MPAVGTFFVDMPQVCVKNTQMQRKLTTIDLCNVSGYSRDQIQAVLRLLPPYCDVPSAERVARLFSPQDLIVISVAYQLEVKCAFRRRDFKKIGVELHAQLNGPRQVTSSPVLVVCVEPATVTYHAATSQDIEGIVIRLRPIFNTVDSYLTGAISNIGSQGGFDFAPALLPSEVIRVAR